MQAILKLSRWQESIPFVIPLTLLGGLMAYRFADVRLDERLLYVLLANILAVIYAFMINDIEDAEDDQKGDPERAKRNVIASGELSKAILNLRGRFWQTGFLRKYKLMRSAYGVTSIRGAYTSPFNPYTANARLLTPSRFSTNSSSTPTLGLARLPDRLPKLKEFAARAL